MALSWRQISKSPAFYWEEYCLFSAGTTTGIPRENKFPGSLPGKVNLGVPKTSQSIGEDQGGVTSHSMRFPKLGQRCWVTDIWAFVFLCFSYAFPSPVRGVPVFLLLQQLDLQKNAIIPMHETALAHRSQTLELKWNAAEGCFAQLLPINCWPQHH